MYRIATIVATITIILSPYTEAGKDKKGKGIVPKGLKAPPKIIDAIFNTDGSVNMEAFVTTLTSCGGPVNDQVATKMFLKIAAECGWKEEDEEGGDGGGNSTSHTTPASVPEGEDNSRRRKREYDSNKLSCTVACVFKKLGFITDKNTFLEDPDKLKKSWEAGKAIKDADKIKKIVKENIICAKIAPVYQEGNCYSIAGYAACSFFGMRRVCANVGC